MFKKKSSSFRGAPKDLVPPTTSSSSPEPAAAAPAPAPEPAPKPAAVVKKEVSKPKQPASIVPPGTKRVLVVGKFVVMTADVENCDAVIVQGNLDGNIKAKYVVIMKGESTSSIEGGRERKRKKKKKKTSALSCVSVREKMEMINERRVEITSF